MIKKIIAFLCAVLFLFSGSYNLVNAEELSENEEEPITEEYVGQPHYDYDEGAYNNIYYNVSMMASSTRCWVYMHYGTSAKLRTELTVYAGTFLGSWNTSIPVINTGTTTDLSSDWNDGLVYIASGAEAIAKISGTQVYYMTLTTYSS